MGAVFWNEFRKMWGKLRSTIPFIAVGVVVPLVLAGAKAGAGALMRTAGRALPGEFLPDGENLVNGYFVTVLIMNGLWIHIPFLLALVAGDQLAGEGAAGTFRLLLTRPASRSRILFAKYCSTLIYTLCLVAFLVGLSLLLGVILFGTGPLLNPAMPLTVIPEADVPLRLLLSLGLAVLGMWSVASLAVLLSACVDNSLGPIVATIAILIIFYVISSVPLELFEGLRPYLFTTYLPLWQKAIEPAIPWGEIAGSAGILGGFSVGFYLVTWYIFGRKDILT